MEYKSASLAASPDKATLLSSSSVVVYENRIFTISFWKVKTERGEVIARCIDSMTIGKDEERGHCRIPLKHR